VLFLGFDTGGTYTDAVIFDPASNAVMAAAKALTTKHDLAIGLRQAMERVLPAAEGDIALVSLSTTLATNALVEGQGSPICLLLIGYDPGSLKRADLGRALGSDPVVFIAGGHDATGEEQAPLDRAALERAVRAQGAKVAAFAVSSFFSVRNPAHELAARALIRELTGLPVTCGHELTSKLDAPRRALTTALNARLIPQLQHLIRAVEGLMAEKAIAAPLMVVKGDGSLVTAEFALTRPVETILSGPAASVVGARHLSGEGDVLVSDMGGTTTDVALLRDGLPILDRNGATVGGWKTMVEAVAVHTFGLGGDSEIRREGPRLEVGPRRLVPLSLLAAEHPTTLAVLEAQFAAERLPPQAGRFALRNRALDAGLESLSPAQAELWTMLEAGPMPLAAIAQRYATLKAVDRLLERGLVIVAGLTPSDAAHILGRQDQWNAKAARLGAELWIREDLAAARAADADVAALAERIVEAVVVHTARVLIASVLGADEGKQLWEQDSLGRRLVDRAVGRESRAAAESGAGELLRTGLTLTRPIVAIGAPAATYYREVARRLGTRLVVPPNAGVCNAVGAVAGGVLQTVNALITSPAEGRFRAHLPGGISDFSSLETAADFALAESRRLATKLALEAGAAEVQVSHSRKDKIHRDAQGFELFIESRIEVTGLGRPRVAAA
jgi:N-methylhydantoinase A/oxoprolinase/acetone carboxylase beta subunit